MKLTDLLAPSHVLLPLEAADKWQAISAIVRRAVEVGVLAETAQPEVEDALLARERSMTTGMEHGIAIPHAAVDAIPDVLALLGISRAGIPFEALDGRPARIIVCLVIPRAKKLLHIKTLAGIARLFGNQDVRERVVVCDDSDAVLEVLRGAEAGHEVRRE